MKAFKFALGIVCLHFFAATSSAADAPLAGTASIVAGAVSALSVKGESRLLSKGDAVYSGDRILTGAAGYVRLGFLDGGSMVLRPNTEFAIEDFRFTPGMVEPPAQPAPPAATATVPVPALQITNQGEVGNRAFFRLVRGGLRAVSGLVGKINREEYGVRTAVATIGIRGTAFSTVFCDATCAADATVQGSLPAGEAALGGTISAVEQGSISVLSAAGNTATVNASQFMLTTASGLNISLPALPGFLATENWLNAAQQGAAAPSAASPTAAATQGAATTSALSSATLSTVPTVASLAAAVAATAAALALEAEDTSTGTTTSPAATSTRPTGSGG
ncbi:MAG: hypothetical protein V4709_08585 [Pseudomonadota bacterium]